MQFSHLIRSLPTQQNLTTYKYGDSVFLKDLSRKIIANEDIFDLPQNYLVLCILSISREGKIDSVSTLGNKDSIFIGFITYVLEKISGNWKEGKESYQIIIPMCFTNDPYFRSGALHLTHCREFFSDDQKRLPIRGIFMRPLNFFVSSKIR